MIVFYLVESGQCMLAIDCDPSEITVENGKAYWKGQAVNNDMTISAYAEVPRQEISFPSPDGVPVSKLFSELTTGPVIPTQEERIAALEDAILTLLGV